MPINLSDPIIKQAYKNYFTSSYGGESQQTNDLLSGIFNSQNNNFDLRSFLESILTGDNSGLNALNNKISAISRGNINRSFNNAANTISENLVGKGLGRSGVSAGALVDLEGQRGTALAQDEANSAARKLSLTESAIYSLLGLDKLDLSTFETLIGGKNAADVNNFNIEQSKFNFADLIPGLFESGGKIGAALLA